MLETYRWRKREEARDAEVVTLRCEADAIVASIATAEEATAQDNHDAGECLIIDGTLYRTTRVIVRGERVSPGINAEETTIIDEIARMMQERGQ